jgi:hypothetical protein
VGKRGIDDIAALVGRVEVDPCRAGTEATAKAEGRIADVLGLAVGVPLDIEADVPGPPMRRGRDGVEKVMEVRHPQMAGAKMRAAAVQVDVDLRRIDRDRPEQAGPLDPWLPVVDLALEVAHGAPKQVNSDEPEAADAAAPVATHILAAHEPHIRIKAVGRAVTPARLALDLTGCDHPAKVRDRGHLKPHRRR